MPHSYPHPVSQASATPVDSLLVDRFVPAIVYVREAVGFHTRVCLYNYFSDLYPDVPTGAKVWMRFFDTEGRAVAERVVPIGYRGQLQFDVGKLEIHFEGTAAVSLVPDTKPKFPHPRLVGTGYYVNYFTDEGHADASHEWEAASLEPKRSVPWLCVVRPCLFPDTSLVVMSSYFGPDLAAGRAEWTVSVRNAQGEVLARRSMPSLPARGCCRLALSEIFPDLEEYALEQGTISVEVNGTNIQGPFTWVRVPSGDFNIHHFC